MPAEYIYQRTPLSKHIYLTWTLAIKSLKVRYKNSVLGFVWSMLTPLLYLAIFTFIFSQAFFDIENYPLFALTGLIFWNFFSSATVTSVNSVIDAKGVLKSIKIPAIILPIAEMISSSINLLLTFVPFGALMFFLGAQVGFETLLLVPLFILFSMFVLGVGIFICALNIFFRDVGLLWTTLMPAIFYFTPIAYSAKLIPEKFLWLINFNPVFHYISAFREVLYYNIVPSAQLWLIISSLSVFFLGLGLSVFLYLEKGFISNY
ncbi:MAG: ABC transporter permease [Vicingaceae bacterium]